MPINETVKLGEGVRIPQPELVNLYGCVIGDQTVIGAFVEIQSGAKIGSRCKISSHAFICEGVTIEDEVFIGHGVMFINDRFPRATSNAGELQQRSDWKSEPTTPAGFDRIERDNFVWGHQRIGYLASLLLHGLADLIYLGSQTLSNPGSHPSGFRLGFDI